MIETSTARNGTTYSVIINNKLLVHTYNLEYALKVEEAAKNGNMTYAESSFVPFPLASIAKHN